MDATTMVDKNWWAGPEASWYNVPDRKRLLGVESWRHQRLRLRVCRGIEHTSGMYYVAPYDSALFVDHCLDLRIGPYRTVTAAMLAAEMIGEIAGVPT